MPRKQKKETISELEDKFLGQYRGDLFADTMGEADKEQVFRDLSQVENIDEFLKSLAKMDRVHYFTAAPASQERIKGAFYRTAWLLKEVQSRRQGTKAAKAFRSKRHEGS